MLIHEFENYNIRCEYEESLANDEVDPSVMGSTVTLMGQPPTATCDDSMLSINNIPSPVG